MYMEDCGWLPSIDDIPTLPTVTRPSDAPSTSTALPSPAKRQKTKRMRHIEHDSNGQWTDVRRFDRMPITTDDAAELEGVSGVPPGTYFVSLARKRLQGIINLHDRWLNKIKNRNSSYAAAQTDLRDFYVAMLAQFDTRYSPYITHPLFDQVGVTRKREIKSVEEVDYSY